MALVEQYSDSGLCVITLNNSEAGNVLNIQSMEEFHKALRASLKDGKARVILLRSNGDNFCLGMDLKMLQETEGRNSLAKKAVALYTRLLSLIYKSPKPVISLIQGNVKAGGMGLACTCDIVIASDNSTFEFSEIFFGLIPANVMPFLYSLRIQPQKLRYLVLTGKKLSAAEAKGLDLVDEVFSGPEMEKGIKSIIKNLLRASPEALAEAKLFTRKLSGKSMEKSISMARKKLLGLIRDPDVMNAIKSFNSGEFPSWFEKFRPEKPLV
ncbi:MAG: enoyl-CoA hydratase/isomerase family protein [bacterium]|nr:enoyl-CoA hydratase/isomerase family protein [bacterium]